VHGPRAPRRRGAARLATPLLGSLLLGSLLGLPVPAAAHPAGAPPPWDGAFAPRVAPITQERPLEGDGPSPDTEVLGFWLGPLDEPALARTAIGASGLRVGPDGQPRIATLADARRLRRAAVAVHERATRRLVTRFRTVAGRLGVTSLDALHSAPLVVARVTADQARVLAALPAVQAVEPSGDVELQMASAYPTVGAPAVYEAGFRGAGVRVGVVEYARIDFSRPTLRDVPREKLFVARTNGHYACRRGDPSHPDQSVSHMTRVAAIIAGRSATAPRGIAPGATIVQASIDMAALDDLETAARVVAAIECAVTVGDADVVNLSLSEPRRESYVRTFVDYLVDTYGVFIAAAAGNAVYGTCPDGKVISPGTAWNVLTVGGTSDSGTADWADDQLWTENGADAVCTGDPRGQPGDTDRRIKPEISAVARNISVAGYPPSSGTSYATPMVSGAAATLLGRDPVLATQPAVVRALLVAASRVHRTRTPGGAISTDREGAGTLSVEWAHAIVSGSAGGLEDVGGYGGRVIGSSPVSTSCRRGEDIALSMAGHRGRTMRVVIAWNAHARRPALGGDPADRRKSDLDLVVRGPDGSVIAGAGTSRAGLSASNIEWLDFVAPETGTYTASIEVARWDCDLDREPVGFAWIAFRTP
jgi:hypothetical protein